MLLLALLLLLACGAEGFVARAAGLPALSPVWPRLPGDPPQSDAPTPPAEARRPLSRRRAAWSRLPADSAFGRRHQSILVNRSALRRQTRRHFSLSAASLWAVTLVTTCIRPALAAAAVPPGEPSLLRAVPWRRVAKALAVLWTASVALSLKQAGSAANPERCQTVSHTAPTHIHAAGGCACSLPGSGRRWAHRGVAQAHPTPIPGQHLKASSLPHRRPSPRRRAGQPIRCPWPFVLVAPPWTELGRRSLSAGFHDWQTWVAVCLYLLLRV